MANEEHGENFSSPSVNIQILKVQNWGTAGEVLKVYLSDGSSFFISPEVYSSSEFLEGDVVSEKDIQFFTAEDDYITTKKKALSLLEYSENSSFQLKTKLLRKGCPDEAIERTITDLEAAGYVDDSRFAEMWIRSRINNRPAGAAVLVGLLRKRGISRGIAEEAVRTQMEKVDPSELLRKAAEKLGRNRNTTPEKLKNRLLKLGFSFSEVTEYLEGLVQGENS